MSEVKTLFSAEEIHSRVLALGEEIARDYNSEVIFVCVLNGAYMFFSDLSKAVWNAGLTQFEIDFVRISSYGHGTKSSGTPHMTKDIETDIAGKDVVIIEDIVETGRTLKFLVDHLEKKSPRSIKICTLLTKPLREVQIEPDYAGFELRPDDWVEGYGLDTGSYGRGRSDIIVRL